MDCTDFWWRSNHRGAFACSPQLTFAAAGSAGLIHRAPLVLVRFRRETEKRLKLLRSSA